WAGGPAVGAAARWLGIAGPSSPPLPRRAFWCALAPPSPRSPTAGDARSGSVGYGLGQYSSLLVFICHCAPTRASSGDVTRCLSWCGADPRRRGPLILGGNNLLVSGRVGGRGLTRAAGILLTLVAPLLSTLGPID